MTARQGDPRRRQRLRGTPPPRVSRPARHSTWPALLKYHHKAPLLARLPSIATALRNQYFNRRDPRTYVMRLQYVRLFHLRGDPMECNRDCDPVGVAVVGAGYWGPNLVRNFANCKQFRLRWLCDLDKRRAEAALGPYSTVAATSDLDAVLADSRIDAVAIATPAASHFALATAALRAGKHVLIEKPLAATYAEGAELVALAERNGLVLMCDHTYCHTPAVKKIREILHEGELGQLHFFDSVRINLGLVQRDVDVLWDLAPHDMSILDSILPPGIEPVTVAAWGADPIGAGHACIAFVTIELTGGAIAHLHVNWLSPTKVR